MHKIVGFFNESIKACCTFAYRGYTVSVSTIFKGGDGIAVWPVDEPESLKSFGSVERAIEYINDVVGE